MTQDSFQSLFSRQTLEQLLPISRSDDFFEALYGDAAEGAYDIQLAYRFYDPESRTLHFELQLHQRPGKCLACNLTYGLPEVFSRHPLINLNGIVKEISAILQDKGNCSKWSLGSTDQVSGDLHTIPFLVSLD
jgi:hypothetical protein